MDELEISGKRYISTRRAAKEHKYHSDYIGQLIRAKKVEGQKVGRSWYVAADSLAEYLGKEVSAKSIPRVEIPALAKEKVEIIKTEEKVEIEEILKEGAPVIVENRVEDEVEDKEAYHIPLKINKRNSLRYLSDDAPLYPLERPVRPHIKLRPIETPEEETVVFVEDEPVVIKSFVIRGGMVLAVGVITLGIVAATSAFVVATTTVEGQNASVSYSLLGM
jgi:hypothetical protein